MQPPLALVLDAVEGCLALLLVELGLLIEDLKDADGGGKSQLSTCLLLQGRNLFLRGFEVRVDLDDSRVGYVHFFSEVFDE